MKHLRRMTERATDRFSHHIPVTEKTAKKHFAQ